MPTCSCLSSSASQIQRTQPSETCQTDRPERDRQTDRQTEREKVQGYSVNIYIIQCKLSLTLAKDKIPNGRKDGQKKKSTNMEHLRLGLQKQIKRESLPLLLKIAWQDPQVTGWGSIWYATPFLVFVSGGAGVRGSGLIWGVAWEPLCHLDSYACEACPERSYKVNLALWRSPCSLKLAQLTYSTKWTKYGQLVGERKSKKIL